VPIIYCSSISLRNCISKIILVVFGQFFFSLFFYLPVSSKPNTDSIQRWNIKHTDINLYIDTANSRISGQENILVISSYDKNDAIILDAKNMFFDSISVYRNGYVDKLISTYYNDTVLKIKFTNQYKIGDTLLISIWYKTRKFDVNNLEERSPHGVYFVYDKPTKKLLQIWTHGQPESNSHWLPTIDKPDQHFTFKLKLTVPKGYSTISNGNLLSTVSNKSLITDTWIMDKEIQPYCIMFFVGSYFLTKDKYGDIDINYYTDSSKSKISKLIFKHTINKIKYFEQITGLQYPWDKYSQIVLKQYPFNAMENTSASTFSEQIYEIDEYNNESVSDNILTHELFHQWFGNYVKIDSWDNLFLNESFANFSEQLWIRKYKGNNYADLFACIELQKYLNSNSRFNYYPIIYDKYDNLEEYFSQVTYQKAGAVLRYFNYIIGDSLFYKSLNYYLQKNTNNNVTIEDWEKSINFVTGKNWDWFIKQFYYVGGHPILLQSDLYDDEKGVLSVVVRQIQDSITYKLPLKVEIYQPNRIIDTNFILNSITDTFQFRYEVLGSRPVALIDANHIIPGDVRNNLQPYQWKIIFSKSKNLSTKYIAVKQACTLISHDVSKSIISSALSDTDRTVRLFTLIAMSSIQRKKELLIYADLLKDIAIHDVDAEVRIQSLKLIESLKIDLTDVGSNLDNLNRPKLVLHTLKCVKKSDQEFVYSIVKRIITDIVMIPDDLKYYIFSVLAEGGHIEDFKYFEIEAYTVHEKQIPYYVNSLSNYLIKMDDTIMFQRTLNLYTILISRINDLKYKNIVVTNLIHCVKSLNNQSTTTQIKNEKTLLQSNLVTINRCVKKIIDEEINTTYKEHYLNLYNNI
jgi:aminopeptidase N